MGFPGTGHSLVEHVGRRGERVLNNICCFALFDLLGCFRTSISVLFVFFYIVLIISIYVTTFTWN